MREEEEIDLQLSIKEEEEEKKKKYYPYNQSHHLTSVKVFSFLLANIHTEPINA